MKVGKLVFIFILTLLIGAIAVYVFDEQQKAYTDQDFGQTYLPGLSNKINDVSHIIIQDEAMTVTLFKRETNWVVKEKSEYPADFSKVKTLLISLAELETIEAKTSRPESYGRLGVQGVGISGNEASTQIKLLNKAGNVISSLIIGKEKLGSGHSKAIYVRKEHEDKSWLVSGSVRVPISLVGWLNKKVIDIDKSRIQSVVINHSDNTSLRISKNKNDDTAYVIEDQPKSTIVKSTGALNGIANSLQSLTLDDVVVRGTFDVDDKIINRINFKTFDDILISAKLATIDDKSYIWFDVKTSNKENGSMLEVQALNSAFPLWVYQIPNFKAEGMLKYMADLVETK